MSEFPSLSYVLVIKALQRLGFVVVRQKGSHIRLHKNSNGNLVKITVPAHKPIKSNTLRQILKQAYIDLTDFKNNL